MGAGKSTVGALAAQMLGWDFIDLDEEIVRREGCSIPEIFEKKKEQGFRICEQEALKSLTASCAVVATGGGILTWPGNLEIMQDSGQIIFLDRPLEKILLDIDTSTRPMLAQGREKIISLYHERRALYERSTPHRVINDLTVENTASKVVALAKELMA
jgi:shikimate kinase